MYHTRDSFRRLDKYTNGGIPLSQIGHSGRAKEKIMGARKAAGHGKKETNVEQWIEDRSPLPDPAPLRERVIAGLEALLAEYRAGRGDVASRMTPFIDEPSGAPRSFVDVVTILMLGEDALPETRFSGGSVVLTSPREYSALARIGDGSAARGAATVVDAALDWARRDREGMAVWCRSALPRLKPRGYFAASSSDGLLRSRTWNIALQHPTWWGDLGEALAGTGIEGSDDIVRAMALAWGKAPWAGRAKAARRRAA